MRRKRKDPLIRRVGRELLGEWRKYVVVSLFLILTIGFVSGMYVANESMLTAAERGETQYKLEDGHFELSAPADRALLDAVAAGERADIYQNFFRNEDEDNDGDGTVDGAVRVYARTEEVNLACLMEGSFPAGADEIALDRMHADNVGVTVGDAVTVGGRDFRVVGLLAYVNYATLHEKSSDFMFDALRFDVAMVTQEGFDRLASPVHYAYAWRYREAPADEAEEKSLSDDFLTALLTQTAVSGVELEDYLPRYANSAINFATDDMGSDKAMGGVLLNILIVIIAFIFAVTISNTIAREAQAIGTLRASGYTRGELVRHYLASPVIVTFLSAAVGNLLGYTAFKYVVVSMYYNSYSLPTYETVWTPYAFFKTTLIPVALMLVVNLLVIVRTMRHTPLEFLRGELKRRKGRKAVRLPRWSFLRRFRMRVMLQNVPNYLILLCGIFFISVLLAMAVGMPDTLDYYKTNAQDMMFARYQYVLRSSVDQEGAPVTTQDAGAEPFHLCTLQRKGGALDEEISVYGVWPDSRYIRIPELDGLSEGQVYVSAAFRDKYHLKQGQSVTLDEKYESRQYQFEVAGVYDKCLSLAVFLPIEHYRSVFDLPPEQFGGFLSNAELTDLDEENVTAVLTERDITKMCDQLDHSMGSYMVYFQVLCVLLSAVLIYLLTKLIIEKNENAISMAKILGYRDREIAGLYLLPTTIALVLADAVSTVLGTLVMGEAWKMIMADFSGWFPFVVRPVSYGKIFLFILLGYLLVLGFDFKRIRRIPMDRALKTVE